MGKRQAMPRSSVESLPLMITPAVIRVMNAVSAVSQVLAVPRTAAAPVPSSPRAVSRHSPPKTPVTAVCVCRSSRSCPQAGHGPHTRERTIPRLTITSPWSSPSSFISSSNACSVRLGPRTPQSRVLTARPRLAPTFFAHRGRLTLFFKAICMKL